MQKSMKSPLIVCVHRSFVAMTFYAVGRSSESIFTTFDISDWDSKEGIWRPMWKEPKTGKEVPMPFVPDVDSWKIDIFHCLACLLITSRSKFLFQCQSSDIINWMFLYITQLENSMVIFLTIYLKNVSPMSKVYAKE